MNELTPRQIVAELDKHIIGQRAAKKAVSIALRNRYRRRQLPQEMRDEIVPKNILMIGPTGVGKTEIARRLATLAKAPFVKVEATKFTEVGYVGRDVDSIIRDLVQSAIRMVEAEKLEEVKEKAKLSAIDRIVDIMQPSATLQTRFAQNSTPNPEALAEMIQKLFHESPQSGAPNLPVTPPAPPVAPPPIDTEAEKKRIEQTERVRAKLREQILSGNRDNDTIQIETEDNSAPSFLHVLGSQPGMSDESASDLQGALGAFMPKRHKKRTLTVREAIDLLADEEARSMIDRDRVTKEAIERAEQTGIVFIDEMDKVAGASSSSGSGNGPDVSREGVQRDLLPIIEGSTVPTKYGPVCTDYILFIAAGAFHKSKPSDLIPELQGRLPIRVELDSLKADDFKRILIEPKGALTKQYEALLSVEGVTVQFTDDGIEEIAQIAALANEQMENIGARRLHTIMERLLDDVSFESPADSPFTVVVNAGYVKTKLDNIVKNEDLSRYIL
jgi:ATP-dependent HslUV protease ATP-binding subunit HslU